MEYSRIENVYDIWILALTNNQTLKILEDLEPNPCEVYDRNYQNRNAINFEKKKKKRELRCIILDD